MRNLHSRSVVTPDEVRRLGPLGAFDWAVAKLRDAVANSPDDGHGYIIEVWLERGRELTGNPEEG